MTKAQTRILVGLALLAIGRFGHEPGLEILGPMLIGWGFYEP